MQGRGFDYQHCQKGGREAGRKRDFALSTIGRKKKKEGRKGETLPYLLFDCSGYSLYRKGRINAGFILFTNF